MTGPVDEGSSGTPDFTKKREPISFVIDGYTYRAPAIMNPINLSKIAASVATVDLDNSAAIMADLPGFLKIIANAVRGLMPGVSGETFAKRLLSDGSPDPDDPEGQPSPQIDLINEGLPAIQYLMESLGKGLPRPSLPSAIGSPDPGTATPSDTTSSTDGASPTE